MCDLFEDDDPWGSVYGDARLFERMGLLSFARSDPLGLSCMWDMLTQKDYMLTLVSGPFSPI